jgi:hypothetical protein
MRALYLLLFLALPAFAAEPESCPQVNGKDPAVIALAEGYKFFYFPDEFLAENQQGALLVSKDGNQVSFEVALGKIDWFGNINVAGDVSGLNVNSQDFGFWGAWVTENGARRDLPTGEAYAPTCLPPKGGQ